MTDKPRMRVRYALICDDLRTEDNGKQILIGVYTGGIVFSRFPASAVITVWCDVEQPHAGLIPLHLKAVFGPDQKELFGVTFNMEVKAPTPVGNFAFKFPLRIEVSGVLRVLLRQHADDWQELKAIDVTQGSTTSSAARLPT